MSQNLADGLRADRAPGTVGAARRRRNRRLRASLKHERSAVAMNLATVQHHSHMKSAVVDVCVQVGSPLAPVTEYVAPAPSVTYAAPAPVFEYVAPAPVLEYIAPAPAVSFVAPGQQLRPASTAAAVTTGVNLDAAVEGSASQVVGLLPLGEVFAAPVFHHVHQEQLAGGEIPETLPPAEEFPVPVYNPVHHEQFSAGDMTENFAFFPVVQEQVLGQAIPRLVGSSPPVDEFTAYVARRPLPLVEVQPSVRAQRHIVEDLGELAPLVQILDLPVPRRWPP